MQKFFTTKYLKVFIFLVEIIFILLTVTDSKINRTISSPLSSTSSHRTIKHNNLVDGALFDSNGKHYCSGSILKSRGHNLITTASHCVTIGNHSNNYFIAGFNNSNKNFIKWKVSSSYSPEEWKDKSNDNYDYAILKLEPQKINGKIMNIQDYINDGLIASNSIKNGMQINVTGYNYDSNDPISCNTKLVITHGVPSFNCKNFYSGVSGSPFEYDDSISGKRYLVGIIGGYEQGGNTADTSYSSPINTKIITDLKKNARNNTKN